MVTEQLPIAKGAARGCNPRVWKAADQQAKQGFLILPIFADDLDSCADMTLIEYALATAHHYTLSQLQDGSARAFIRLDPNGMRAQAVVASSQMSEQ